MKTSRARGYTDEDQRYDAEVERQVGLLRVECAWHPKFFGVVKVMREAAPGHEKEGVSDTICPECRERLDRERKAVPGRSRS